MGHKIIRTKMGITKRGIYYNTSFCLTKDTDYVTVLKVQVK